MRYTIVGGEDSPMAHVHLGVGETIKLESGSMVFMQEVELEGKANSNSKGLGGLLSAAARSLTSGESFFISQATGMTDKGLLGIAPSAPGRIHALELDESRQYRLNTGAFLACDASVSYVMKSQDIGKAFFGGTGGFFVMETEGRGQMLINAFGSILELQVTPDRPLTVDNTHVVAWDRQLDYSIRAASGTFGFMTGEGLANEFRGSGTVLIQTRNMRSMAEALKPFIVTKA